MYLISPSHGVPYPTEGFKRTVADSGDEQNEISQSPPVPLRLSAVPKSVPEENNQRSSEQNAAVFAT